jgi:2-deoxy-D-gluconate 3-dehydrogenase
MSANFVDCNTRTPIKYLFSLKDKTAIVTGATGGIGLVVATALAESGASIISIQIPDDPAAENLRQAIEGAGQTFKCFECNLLDAAAIKECFERIWAANIVPDILFHAAGISHRSTIVDTTVEMLNRVCFWLPQLSTLKIRTNLLKVIDLNIKAAYLVCQAFAARMLKLGRKGKIINIASMAAELVQTNIAVYSSSKAFVKSMTRAMSNEWAGQGIQVNSISPGFIHAGMAKALGDDPEFAKYVSNRTSTGRWGTPDDLRGVTIFLASSASDFITGADILVDGGVLGT